MRYSLLSRFQGTLLGAAIGQVLSDVAGMPLEWSYLCQVIPHNRSQGEPTDLDQLIRLQAELLIQFGDLNLEVLRQRWASHSDPKISGLTSTQVMAGMLPVVLFFHEDETKLGQRVSAALSLWHSSELRFGTLAVAYAIAQALRERLDSATLIAQTVTYLQQPAIFPRQQDSREPDPLPLILLLEQVQTHLVAGSGLNTTLTQLLRLHAKPVISTSLSVALAFYCFLSTLEDFRLTVTRAVRTPQPQLTVLLAAALSGAYNSSAGVPLGWQLFSQKTPAPRQLLAPATTLGQLADQLAAAWSGVYEPLNTSTLGDLSQAPAIAASGLIRPR